MTRFVSVGDIMLGDSSNTVGFGLHSRYPHADVLQVLADLAPRFAGADVVLGNLECPLTPVGVGDSAWARDQMRGDITYAAALRAVGFTAISVGNNHAMQHGEAGFEETVCALRKAGLHVVGLRGAPPWACQPIRTVSGSGANVVVLGYSWRPRQYGTGPTPYADAPLDALLPDIERAASSADVVIVSMHWGDEFVCQPSTETVAAARAMVSAGASCVVGHHPHVTQPVTMISGRPVAFSLGNAVSDMSWLPSLREGYLLDAVFSSGAPEIRVSQILIDNDYRIRIGTDVTARARTLVPLDAEQYRTAVRRGLATQRSAQYSHLITNATRLAPGVLSTLVGTTVRNKWRALCGAAGAGT